MRALLIFAFCLLSSAAARSAPSATFQASIEPLSAAEQARMTGRSWKEGCPVPLGDLVAIRLDYVGFDHAVHDGVLVVHRRLAKEVVEVFHALFDAGCQIERMQPYEDFPIGEYAAHNDTVGFYCRPAQDDPNTFSWHAYGVAIDLNPRTNPYHDPRGWWPKGSDGERERSAPGLISARSTAVQIFMAHGWAWGGLENSAPDYMHFGKVTIGNGGNPLERQVWAERLEYAPN
jgi:hypothetical protein